MRANIRSLFAACSLLGLSSALAAAGMPQGASSSPKIYVLKLLSDEVVIFRASSDGNVQPLGVLAGSDTKLNDPVSVAFDARGNLYVLNKGFMGTIAVYAPDATGNARPIRSISGFNTGLRQGPESLALDAAGNVYVSASLRGQEGGKEVYQDGVLVFPPGANGDVAPVRTIKGPATRMRYIHGIAVDRAGNLYVASGGERVNGRATDMRVTVYAPGANGNAAPARTIEGPDTGLEDPFFLALDRAGNLYVANQRKTRRSVTTTVYARGASGNARPIRTLQGPAMHDAGDMGVAIAVDGAGQLYVGDHDGAGVLIYPPGAGGNTPPARSINGPETQLSHPRFVAVWPMGPATPVAAVGAAAARAAVARPVSAGTARVTAVRLRVEPRSYAGACPKPVRLVGEITTDGPGEAYYQFQAGAVGGGRQGTIHFEAAGTKTVTSLGQIRQTPQVQSVRFLAGLEPRGHQENAKWADVDLELKCGSSR